MIVGSIESNIKRILNLMLLEKKDIEIEEDEIKEEGEEETPDVETPTSSTGTETDVQTTGYPSVTKWESGRTFGKTYMNDPKYKWESGRKLGPTYNGPNSKWASGITRGKANPLN
jgi:hypothetical protein